MYSVEILKNKSVEVLGFDPCVAEDSINGTKMNDKIIDDQRDGRTLNNSFGPSQSMVQFGCFGPFPNPFHAIKTKLAQIRHVQNVSSNFGSSNIYSQTTKKRKRYSSSTTQFFNFAPPGIPPNTSSQRLESDIAVAEINEVSTPLD